MATQLKLAYGLRDERLLHITEVANGLACACTCPGCGARLVARNQGIRKVPHFAHYQAPECAHGLQTALHLAAKDIISQHRQFALPGIVGAFTFTEHFWSSFTFDAAFYESCIPGDVGVPAEYSIPSRYIDVQQVSLERRTHDIVPDVILHTGTGELLVEVAVTHFVDEVKREKIKRLGISCIEIDLSKLDRTIDLEQLEKLLIHGLEEKRWIFNDKLKKSSRRCGSATLRQHAPFSTKPTLRKPSIGTRSLRPPGGNPNGQRTMLPARPRSRPGWRKGNARQNSRSNAS